MQDKKLSFDFRSGDQIDRRLVTVRNSPGTNPGGWDFTHDGAVGPLREFPGNTPRLGYGVGVLLENASTNAVRNPRGEGAATGTPGTLPTHWTINAASANVELVATGVELGWPFVEIRLSGTPSGPISLWFETETGIAAIPGDTWTLSLGARRVGGDLTNIVACVPILETRSASASLATETGAALSLDEAHRRAVLTATASDGSTAHVRPGFQINSTGAIDLTVRVYAPQSELSAFATSPILPPLGSLTSSTRSDDKLSLTLASGWTGEGVTLITDFSAMGLDDVRGRQNIWSLDDGSFSNILNVFVHDSGSCLARVQRGGVSDGFTGIQWGVLSHRAGPTRIVAGFSKNAACFEASIGSDEASALSQDLLFDATHLRLGSDPAGRSLNGYLQALHLIPERLSDQVLGDLSGRV